MLSPATSHAGCPILFSDRMTLRVAVDEPATLSHADCSRQLLRNSDCLDDNLSLTNSISDLPAQLNSIADALATAAEESPNGRTITGFSPLRTRTTISQHGWQDCSAKTGLATIRRNARPTLFLDVFDRRMALILTPSTDYVLAIDLVSDPTPVAVLDCSTPAFSINLTTL
ncbi:MAG: hypothetical protein ACI92S_004841 [Planctomycetaceae bacterium]|jgi:hypothetical protein